MSIVSYDEKFDKKVEAGADILLKHRNIPAEDQATERRKALEEARLVLLAAAAVDAQA